jgi:hypothetical protein
MSKDYSEWAEAGFSGGSKEELREAARDLGVELPPNINEENIRNKLRAKMGLMAPKAEEFVPQEASPGERPNLSGNGRWGGRRHDVTLQRPQGHEEDYVGFGWEGPPLYIAYGVRTAVPEPHWNAIQNAKKNSFNVLCEVNRQQGVLRDETVRSEQAYPYMYHGVTKGTEHLPGSLLEWYQWEAKKRDYFARTKKAALEGIYAELSSRIAPEKWDKERLRFEVLALLGPEFEKHGRVEEDEAA